MAEPMQNDVWYRKDGSGPAAVLAVKDGRVAVDDPSLGLIAGTLAEFHGLYDAPSEPWRDPQPSTLTAAVNLDGTLGPMKPGATAQDIEAARLGGYPAVVTCDVVPRAGTLVPLR